MERKWIEQRLADLGKTKKGLAEHLGVAPPRVNEIIRHERDIQADEIIPLARFMELPVMVVMARLFPGQVEPGAEPAHIKPARTKVEIEGLAELVRLAFLEVDHVLDVEGMALKRADWAEALMVQFKILYGLKYDDELTGHALESAGQAVANNVIRADFARSR